MPTGISTIFGAFQAIAKILRLLGSAMLLKKV